MPYRFNPFTGNFDYFEPASTQIQVSGNDSTPDYLENKVAAGTGISLATLNEGANEQLEITAAAGSARAFYFAASI